MSETKLIIAGSRSIDSLDMVKTALSQSPWSIGRTGGRPVDRIITGGAEGVDESAEILAESRGVPVDVVEADWDEYGKSAGPLRNEEMAERGDILLAIWDGTSTGTRDMVATALGEGLDVYVHRVDASQDRPFN